MQFFLLTYIVSTAVNLLIVDLDMTDQHLLFPMSFFGQNILLEGLLYLIPPVKDAGQFLNGENRNTIWWLANTITFYFFFLAGVE